MEKNKQVVIAGSAKMQSAVETWKTYWEEKEGHVVSNFPKPIPRETFLSEYPQVHEDFFKDIEQADVLFIANEDKNETEGYIGAETFAEIVFGIAQNLLHEKQIDIILAKMPSKAVQSHEEITLWITLGWLRVLEK